MILVVSAGKPCLMCSPHNYITTPLGMFASRDIANQAVHSMGFMSIDPFSFGDKTDTEPPTFVLYLFFQVNWVEIGCGQDFCSYLILLLPYCVKYSLLWYFKIQNCITPWQLYNTTEDSFKSWEALRQLHVISASPDKSLATLGLCLYLIPHSYIVCHVIDRIYPVQTR